jgi:hypothetical protein
MNEPCAGTDYFVPGSTTFNGIVSRSKRGTEVIFKTKFNGVSGTRDYVGSINFELPSLSKLQSAGGVQ